jgi:lipopolysaccharide/colanic/teichoic acid biosynthesis glycosyltransferase
LKGSSSGTGALPGKRPNVRVAHLWYEPVKRAIEVFLAVVLMVLAAPVMLVAAVLVKLTSPGPVFYSQTRIGKHHRYFRIYKIRTMIHNCEQVSGPRWSTPGDPRVTPVGRFLRQTHIDELPQLLNVLLGHMSLVGPRPERPEFFQVLQQALPGYRDRLLVRPGVTGLAQVQLPPDSDLASVRRKLAYDLLYVSRLGPWLDLRILCCTAFYALGIPYRISRRVFRMPHSEEADQSAEGNLVVASIPLPGARAEAGRAPR